jgi:hypothetical protein
MTLAGVMPTAPWYASPEAVEDKIVSFEQDQYALAVIAYTLLVGRHPFPGSETARLVYQIAHEAPPAPSSLKPSLAASVDEALLKALSKNPEERFRSCTDFMQALAETQRQGVGFWEFIDRLFGKQPEPAPASVGATAVFKATAPPESSTEATSEFEPPKPATPPQQPKEGATQVFAKSGVAPPPAPPLPPPPAPQLPTRVQHGEFTRMFGSPPAAGAQPPPAPPSSGPGEFTKLFKAAEQTVILRKAPEERPDAEMLARAQSRELIEVLESRDFESAVMLRGKWLPGIEGASGELIGFSEAARYLGAAQDAVSPHVRIEHLKRAEQVLFSVGNQLLSGSSPAGRHLPAALEAWKAYARELLAAAQHKAASELPNPFRAGQPLRPDQGRAVFRGRTTLVRNIDAILADADQSSSLALLGPRRCGKTSLLQMLPAMLPDCACVFFDLQDNPVSTVAEFFEALARRAREQVRAQRRIEIPGLEGDGTFEAATRWFDRLDSLAEINRFLISIDEFERLEDLFPGDRRDLLRLMGLFRATIQHRRKVRLLVSGVAPFEELGPLWNDHFINVRELRIGHLEEQTAVDLLSKPIPEFPPDAVPLEVARRVFERTAGQPYLLQLFGTLLINRLNEQERMTAVPEDVAAIEQEALAQGRYYFGNTYQDAPEQARKVLEALACGQAPNFDGATRRWLERRWLIDDDGALRTPVLGAFIREELGL